MGSFRIKSPFVAIQKRVEQAKQEIEDGKHELLMTIGVGLLSLAQSDYRTLSRGGTASDGRRWKALDPKTIAAKARKGRQNSRTTATGKTLPGGQISSIGIDSGLQFASGSPGFTATGGGNIFEVRINDVTVGYGRAYSKHFDAQRKLLPDTLPPMWRTFLEGIVQRWLEKIVAGTIAGG